MTQLSGQKSESLTNGFEKAVKRDLPSRGWPVYKGYDVVVDDESGESFVVASVDMIELTARDDVGNGQWVEKYRVRDPQKDLLRSYLPLRKPELVVDLARLADRAITPQAMVGWASEYGLLASSREEDTFGRIGLLGPERFTGHACRESVAGFAKAAGEIRTCVRIYEALSGSEDFDLEKLSSEVGALPEDAMRPGERKQGHERAWLFGVLGRMTQMRLQEHCYPQFNTYVRGGYPTGRFSLSWGFYNLIGAIWLQMAWLLEDDDNVRFCRLPDCRRVITFEPGKSADEVGTIKDAEGKFKRNARGEYKDRSDRLFCKGRPCKQKYHYRKKAGWPRYR